MAVLTLLTVLFLFISLSNLIYNKIWQKNLTFDLSFSSREAFEGDKLILTEVLINRKILPLPWVAIKFQVSKHLLFTEKSNYKITDYFYKNDIFSIMSYQKITRNLDFVCGKRGVYKIKSAELLSNNLMFTEKLVMHVENAAFLTVYPKLLSLAGLTTSFSKITGELIAKRHIIPDPFEFRGIREYQPFDDFKTINFKATAKANGLMVNMYEYTVSKEIIIYLNFDHYSQWIDISLFEKTISLAATLACYYIRESVPVRIISGSRDILDFNITDSGSGLSSSHLSRVYEALARLDLESPAEPILNLLPDTSFSSNENKVHILISTYYDSALINRFNELRLGFSNIYWLLPYIEGMKLDGVDENIIKWEANHEFETEIPA